MPPQPNNQLHEPQATLQPWPTWLGFMFFLIPAVHFLTSWLPLLPRTVLAEGLLFGLISWATWKTPRTPARTLLFGVNALIVLALAADQLWLRWEWLSLLLLYAPGVSMVLYLAALLDLAQAYRVNQQNESVR